MVPGRRPPRLATAACASRVLAPIVHCIVCARAGFLVDVVNEEDALTAIGREASAAVRQADDRARADLACKRASLEKGRSRRPLSSMRDDNMAAGSSAAEGVGVESEGVMAASADAQPCGGRVLYFTGRVDVEPLASRKTRSVFVPGASFPDESAATGEEKAEKAAGGGGEQRCYRAIIFPSAMLDASAEDETSCRPEPGSRSPRPLGAARVIRLVAHPALLLSIPLTPPYHTKAIGSRCTPPARPPP